MADNTNWTDRRFHAAYQRGYEGPASETADRAETHARRPRRPTLGANSVIRYDPTQPDGELSHLAPEGEVTPDSFRDVAPPTSAFDKRVPITLALLGAAFLAIGLALMWIASSTMSDGSGTQSEEFLRTLTYYIPSAALPVGLITIGAAIAMKAMRT